MLQKIRAHTNRKRAALFFAKIQHLPKPLAVIDLGGTEALWRRWGIKEQHGLRITLINNHHIDKNNIGNEHLIPFIEELIIDAMELTVLDLLKYDLIFSNSFIEHLEDFRSQKKICSIIESSGKPYFIQIPNKHSLIDPHFPHPLVPFFALYPKPLQAWLLMQYHFGSGSRNATYVEARKRVRFYNPIGVSEIRSLLPSGHLVKESFLSLIVHRGLD